MAHLKTSARGLSDNALRFLAQPAQPLPDRTAEALPAIRANAKALATADMPRLCNAHGIEVEEILIGGIPCLDVRPPKVMTTWPILYGFGGGFVSGGPIEDLPILAPLSVATGARIITPYYRLAPEHPWPAAVDDGFAVYREMAGRPFAIVGESAGGNLVLSLMLHAREEGLALPRAAALLSPWCDLSNVGDSLTFNDGRDPTLATRGSFQTARHYAGDSALDHAGVSPINGAFDDEFPSFLITTGTRDLLLSQAVRLAQKLRDDGADVDLHVWEGLWHVFEWYDDIPEASQSINRIAGHLTKKMNQ